MNGRIDKIDFVYYTTCTRAPEFTATIVDSGDMKFVSSTWENVKYTISTK